MAEVRYRYRRPNAGYHSDNLHAELQALGLPGYLFLNLSGDVAEPVFSQELSPQQEAMVRSTVMRHVPPPKRRTRPEAMVANELEAWFLNQVPNDQRTLLERMAKANAASLAAQMQHDPELAKRRGIPVDGDEVTP